MNPRHWSAKLLKTWFGIGKKSPIKRRRSGCRLAVETLEDRLAPATFVAPATHLTLNLNVANATLSIVSAGTSYSLTLTGDTWSGTNSANVTGNGTNQLTVTAAGLTALSRVQLVGSAANTSVTFNNSGANAYSDDFTISLINLASGTITFNGNSSFAGFSTLGAETTKNIVVNPGASVTTVNGSLLLRANRDTTTTGNFIGINVNAGLVQATGNGSVEVIGKGGTDAGGNQIGIGVHAGGKILGGTSGTTTIDGTGGAGGSTNVTGTNHGVWVSDVGSQIGTAGSNLVVPGHGNGASVSRLNIGVVADASGVISAGGSGTVTVDGTGSTNVGAFNLGVYLKNSGTITSSGGNVQVTGTQGGSGSSFALEMSGGKITTAASGGTITVIGDQMLLDPGSSITAGTQTVRLRQKSNSVAMDLGAATDLVAGPLALSDAELDLITAGTVVIGDAGSGPITVSSPLTLATNLSLTTGAGVTVNQPITMAVNKNLTVSALGTSNGTINLANTNSDLAASGTGAISLTTARDVSLASGSSIVSVNGAINVEANQQATPTTGAFSGVSLSHSTIQSTGSGSITLKGRGGNSGFAKGVVTDGASILGGTSGTVLVQGTGGPSVGNFNYGFELAGNSIISTAGADIEVTGTGGGAGASSANNMGLELEPGQIAAGGAGAVILAGTGGAGGAGNNHGIFLTGTSVSAVNGNIQATGAAGPGATSFALLLQTGGFTSNGAANIALLGDSMSIGSSATVNAGNNTVHLQPRSAGTYLDVGSADFPGVLGLTDAELDRVTAGTLQIGDSSVSGMGISQAVTRSAATNMFFVSGSFIAINPGSINTGGGTLRFTPGSGRDVQPATSGVDATAATVSFAPGADLGIYIGGVNVVPLPEMFAVLAA